MKNYKVSFTLVERKTVTVSPHTGKPYKKPHIHRNWIELTEYIMAEDLDEALTKARVIADTENWELNAINEIQRVAFEA